MPDPMTIGIEELDALEKRVQGATGPDRALDVRIQWTLNGATFTDAEVEESALIRVDRDSGDEYRACDGWTPELTASLDAALALVERVLPRWEIRATLHDPHVRLNNRSHTVDVGALGNTPPLALLSALIAALRAKAGA